MWRQRFRSLVAVWVTIALSMTGVAGSSPAVASPVVGNTSLTTEVCTPVSDLSITYPTAEVRVHVTVTNAVAVVRDTKGLRAASGLAFPDTQGSTSFGFESTVSDAQAALASVGLRALAAGAVSLTITVTPAGAAFNPANGHFYGLIPGPLRWSQALEAAEKTRFDGVTGYLATVTSAEENAFIAQVAGIDAWLGASDSAGSFTWQAGPEKGQSLSYTNWLPGEPNDFGGKEEFLSMKSGGGWNDVGSTGSPSDSLGGAMVEFDSATNPPRTSTWTFQATGTARANVTSCDLTPRVAVQISNPGSETEPTEFTITGVPNADNPYDPGQADIWGTVTQPDGSLLRMPAFWMRPFSGGSASGAAGWFLRFKATQSGQHRLVVEGTVGSVALTSAPVTFTPLPSSLPRIVVKGSGFIAGDQPWIPISYNMGWATRGQEATLYDAWFRKAAANGVNSARLWMPSWGTGIEWNDTGLGNYERRQSQAAALDEIMKAAAKYKVRIVLVLLNHGAFSLTTNSEWAQNPYNQANGGPLADPGQFVTNPVAIGFWERRLRYIAARWAASPALFTWEWWNEVDYTPVPADDLSEWTIRSTQALSQWDPYDHLTTTSWASAPSTRDWSTVDWVSVHLYDSKDPLISLGNIREALQEAGVTKPIVMAELGSSATGEDATLDPRGLHMRTGQWAAVFVGFAGPASYWWWDVYVDVQGLWGSTRGLATVLQGRDISQMNPAAVTAPSSLVGRALVGGDTTLVWLRHRDLTRDALIRKQREAAIAALKTGTPIKPAQTPVFRPSAGSRARVPVSFSGAATVTFIHATTGKRLLSMTAQSRSGVVSIPLIGFAGDVAVVVSRGRR